MRSPSSSGHGTLGEELMAVQRLTGQKQPELEFPPVPLEFSSVYSHYGKISDMTDSGIKAYCDLMCVKFTPDQIEILKDINHVSRAVSVGKKPDQILELFGWQS